MKIIEGWGIDFDQHSPIYQQIINKFCRSIIKGEINLGQRIPSIRDMAVMLKVNANTVSRAYQEMERMNLIFSQRGTGYFVMEDQSLIAEIKYDMVRQTIEKFLAEMRALGFDSKQILDEITNQIKGEKLCN